MDTFNDENPFDHDIENIASETSSTSKVDLSEPSSPLSLARQLSPTSPHHPNHPFPSTGSHRQPQISPKTDFCCARDRVLHSGEDIEILVCSSSDSYMFLPFAGPLADYRCAEDLAELIFSLHSICYTNWG